MVIGVDIDGVLADFNEAYIDLVIEESGRDLFPPRPFDIPCWSYPEFYGYTTNEVSRVWKRISQDETFWWRLRGYPDASDFLKALKRLGQEVFYITSRPGVKVQEQTEMWLDLYGFPGAIVFISSEKGERCRELGVNLYLDDKVENCEDVDRNAPTTCGYMLSRPWNKPILNVPRIDTLAEFLYVIKSWMVFKGE